MSIMKMGCPNNDDLSICADEWSSIDWVSNHDEEETIDTTDDKHYPECGLHLLSEGDCKCLELLLKYYLE